MPSIKSTINMNMLFLIIKGKSDDLTGIETVFINSYSVPLGVGNYSGIEEKWDWFQPFESIIICAYNNEAGVKLQKRLLILEQTVIRLTFYQ